MLPYAQYSDVFQLLEKRFPSIRLRTVQESILSTLQRQFYHTAQRVAVLAAPTGSGKSLIAELSAEYLRLTTNASPAWYVAPTIHLQQQYLEDFRRYGISSYVFLAGRGVYLCPYLTDKHGQRMDGRPFTAEDCIYVTGLRRRGESCPYRVTTVQQQVASGKWPAVVDSLSREGLLWSWVNLPGGWAIRYFNDPQNACPYDYYRLYASRAAHVVTNYDVLLLEWANDTGPELSIPGLLVFDEAHVLFDKISSRFGGKISLRAMFAHYHVPFEEYISAIGVSGTHLLQSSNDTSVAQVVAAAADVLESHLREVHDDAVRSAMSLDIARLRTYANMMFAYPSAYSGSSFKVSRGVVHIKVDPVRLLGVFIRRYLSFRLVRPDGVPHGAPPEARKVIIMSGTVGDYKLWRAVADVAGLSRIEWSYHDFSTVGFPPDIRPVYYVPLYPVTRANFVEHVDHFATVVASAYYDLRRLSEQGYYVRPAVVVHAYLRSAAEYLASTIANIVSDYGEDPASVYLAIADDDEPIRETIDSFKKTGGILVSTTGAAEGVDFKDDLARLQFIFKAPFPGRDYPPDLRDFYVMKTVVQMAGRVARSADDFGATFIVDEYALRHYEENTDIYPAYYRDAVRIFPRFEDAYTDYRRLFQQYVPRVSPTARKEVSRE